jgi:multimeric flavodoxin WrbA/putative sterol carrier protein
MRAALPHIIITLYVTALNMINLGSSGLRFISLAVALFMGFALYLSRKQGGVSPVGQGYLLYLLFNVAAYWMMPAWITRPVTVHPATFLYGSLAAVTVVPALGAKRYFTEYFARKTTPPAVWQTDIFKRINRNMTWVWAGFFVASMAITLIPAMFSLQRNLFTALLVPIGLPAFLMLFVGVPFNKRYPGHFQRKMGITPSNTGNRTPKSVSTGAASNTEERITKEEAMSNQLKVVAINGSPHAGVGNASIMTQMMKPTLAADGIELEEIFLADKRIEYCVGCGVCLEKGKCWRQDDHGGIVAKLLAADGVILASPVYFRHVTAQMKTFLDRSLAYGHKPRTTWKPGVAISVSAGMAETATVDYLAGALRVYGAFSVGTLTAIAVAPGGFLGMDLVEARARDVAHDLSSAIREKRRYPATDNDLFFYLFMGDLVRRQKDFMVDDYRHWEESGLYRGFEAYTGQTFAKPPYDPELRKEWVREMISKEVQSAKERSKQTASETRGPHSARTCEELIKMMPLGFKKEAAGNLKAVYQFEIEGAENFTAHLSISDGRCVYANGPHQRPDVVVKSPADVWLGISKGEINGQAAFMSGKYRVEGDLGLLMKLGSLFGS